MGILILIVPLLFQFSGIFRFQDKSDLEFAKAMLSIASLLVRIFACIWDTKIARRQNRNATGWGWFAFFFPSFALIIIGFLRKITFRVKFNKSRSANTQAADFAVRAKELLNEFRYQEALSLSNTILLEVPEHETALFVRAMSSFSLKNYSAVEKDFIKLKAMRAYEDEAERHLVVISRLNNSISI